MPLVNCLNFIIIGAQKGGSSFLQNLLKQHPEVEMPTGETPIFQYPDFDEIKDIDDYINKLFTTHKLKGIKRPNYIGQPESPKLIESYGGGNIKIIAVLRDPVDRFFSAYLHAVRNSWIKPYCLNKKLKNILKKENLKPVESNLFEYGFYAKYLEMYKKTIQKENLLILDFNYLTKSPQLAFNLVCTFLNISQVEVDNYILSKRINRGSKNYLELTKNYLTSKLIYTFDKKNQRLHRKEDLSALVKKLLYLINRSFNFLNSKLNIKKIKFDEKIKNKIELIYLEDQNKLKKFNINKL